MEELISTFVEEYEGALDQFEKGKYKNTLILLSKALFALCDVLMYARLNKLPANHSERFRMLESYFPEIYVIVDELFSSYTDAYSQPVASESCEALQDGIRKITRIAEVPKRIKELVER